MAAPRERVIVGIHAVEEALKKYGRDVSRVWVRADATSADVQGIATLAQKSSVKVEKKSRQQLDQLAQVHQNVAAFTLRAPELDWEALKTAESSLLLVLDGIEDPHNLGAIVRTAWLMDVHGIFVPASRAVGLTATVSKVASGGAEHIPVDTTSNIESTLIQLKEMGYWVYGLSHEATQTVWQTDLHTKAVLAIGSEEKGLRSTTQKHCDALVTIPQVAVSASYNASVAAALAMGEWKRLRTNKKL